MMRKGEGECQSQVTGLCEGGGCHVARRQVGADSLWSVAISVKLGNGNENLKTNEEFKNFYLFYTFTRTLIRVVF